MILIFMIQMVCFSYFGSLESDFTACFLYTFCLWVSAYYFWKYICESHKRTKLAYVFLSNIMFSFVIILKLLSSFIGNL